MIEKMKTIHKINRAFTLIELLVVIVIIGILATISTATFSSSQTKARDISRTSFVRQFSDILIAEGISTHQGRPDKFNFTPEEISLLLNTNNLEVPISKNICPRVVIDLGPDATTANPLGTNSENNNLCVLSWNESEKKIFI